MVTLHHGQHQCQQSPFNELHSKTWRLLEARPRGSALQEGWNSAAVCALQAQS